MFPFHNSIKKSIIQYFSRRLALIPIIQSRRFPMFLCQMNVFGFFQEDIISIKIFMSFTILKATWLLKYFFYLQRCQDRSLQAMLVVARNAFGAWCRQAAFKLQNHHSPEKKFLAQGWLASLHSCQLGTSGCKRPCSTSSPRPPNRSSTAEKLETHTKSNPHLSLMHFVEPACSLSGSPHTGRW